MTGGEKMLEMMKTPEWKEKASTILKGIALEMAENRKKTEIIFSNTEYINWLIIFTNQKGGFSDDDWLYFPEQIDQKDKEFVDNFNLFYSGIERYATSNYIYPDYTEYGTYYRIKYNNTGFIIGMEGGQGTYFYCKRIEVCDGTPFIDINDIINNKKQDNVDYIENYLNEFSNLIKKMYYNGIKIETITSTFNKTIKELEKNNEEKEKIQIKKK